MPDVNRLRTFPTSVRVPTDTTPLPSSDRHGIRRVSRGRRCQRDGSRRGLSRETVGMSSPFPFLLTVRPRTTYGPRPQVHVVVLVLLGRSTYDGRGKVPSLLTPVSISLKGLVEGSPVSLGSHYVI